MTRDTLHSGDSRGSLEDALPAPAAVGERTTITSPEARSADAVGVIPVMAGDREVGAWITGPGGTVYRPVIDVTWLAGAVLAAAAVAVAATAAARPRTAIGRVTMGPGGWVSLKGLPRPRMQAEPERPLWARLLGADRFRGNR
jgi:hypothetical protein